MPIDLNTLPDEDPEAPPLPDFNNLPPQGGGGFEPEQPGVYHFRAPKATLEQLSKYSDKMPTEKGPRLMVQFKEDIQLHNLTTGKRTQWQVNDNALERGKKGSGNFVSDLTYLFHATGYLPNTGGMKGQLNALLAMCGGNPPDPPGEWFMTATLTATCSTKRDIYKDVDGQSVEQKGTKGCGGKFTSDPYPNKNPKVPFVEELPKGADGKYVSRVTCKCGASVRAFNDWRQIRGVE